MTTKVCQPGMQREVQVEVLRVAHAGGRLNRRLITKHVQGAAARDTERAVHLLALHGAVILRDGRLGITDIGRLLLKNYDVTAAHPGASRESRRRQIIRARRLFQRA